MSTSQIATEIADTVASTETLETELREREEALSRHQRRFQQIREELRRRRETRDEQPKPVELTEGQQREEEELNAARAYNTMVNKIIAMESEQAKLVVEAEIAKAAQREAEERLALLAKMVAASGMKDTINAAQEALLVMAPTGREPLSRETAYKIALTHMNKAGLYDEPPTWAIDAAVEASR